MLLRPHVGIVHSIDDLNTALHILRHPIHAICLIRCVVAVHRLTSTLVALSLLYTMLALWVANHVCLLCASYPSHAPTDARSLVSTFKLPSPRSISSGKPRVHHDTTMEVYTCGCRPHVYIHPNPKTRPPSSATIRSSREVKNLPPPLVPSCPMPTTQFLPNCIHLESPYPLKWTQPPPGPSTMSHPCLTPFCCLNTRIQAHLMTLKKRRLWKKDDYEENKDGKKNTGALFAAPVPRASLDPLAHNT